MLRHYRLKKDSAYYYEFHMKAFDGEGDVELKVCVLVHCLLLLYLALTYFSSLHNSQWRTPNDTGYVSIPSENLHPLVDGGQLAMIALYNVLSG